MSKPLGAKFRAAALVLLASSLFVSAFFIYRLYTSRAKIAFVRSAKLVYSYNGMKQAHEEYTQVIKEWQANVDTLKNNYERRKAALESMKNLSADKRKIEELELEKMKKDLINYTTVVQEQAKEKETKMTEGVLNQINSYVETYAKERGYDIVLGSESSGSILYGREVYDITDEVIEGINKDYKVLPPAEGSVSIR